MSAHTPGPWNVSGGTIVFAGLTSSHEIVADTVSGDDSQSFATACANARLIAAAPELLAALIVLQRECDWHATFSAHDPLEIAALRTARAALAKAGAL